MFPELREINKKPEPFQFYTAPELWMHEHTSQKMLEYHLNESIDAASRNINFINHSVEWIIDHFAINSASNIIDFGCGPGLYTSRFARAGGKVTGIDFSKRSLDYAENEARRNGLNINYISSNYLEFHTDERYDLITMIMCDYCALSPLQRKRLLTQFHSLLKPNGSVLFDVYSLKYFQENREFAIYELNQLNQFWSPNDYYCFVNRFKYESENLILDKYTIIEENSQKNVYNWFQCFSTEMIELELAENGLEVNEFFSDVAGAPFRSDSSEFAIVAKRTAEDSMG